MKRYLEYQRFVLIRSSATSRTDGFTLVELLVVIAMIAMLVTVMLPAVQMARSAARRAKCKSNLLQVVMAAQNFEMANEYYSAGVTDKLSDPIRSVEERTHQSWTIALLPFLDEIALHGNINTGLSVYDEQNAPVREIMVPAFECPSQATGRGLPKSSFAACHNDVESMISNADNGVFYLNSQTTVDDIRDGLSHTIFFGEKVDTEDDLGWLSGTRATLRNTGTPINVDPWRTVVRITEGKQADGMEADEESEDLEDLDEETDEDEEEGEEELEDELDDDDMDDGDVEDLAYGDEDSDWEEGDAYGFGGDGYYVEEQDFSNRTVIEEPLAIKTEGSVGGFGSRHTGGAHVAFGDGRIQFISVAVDANILQQLGHRSDGKLLNPDDYRE